MVTRATRGTVIANKSPSSLHILSLNKEILKLADRIGNDYTSLSFSEIASPIIAGSKKFCTISSTSFIRSFISRMVRKE